MPPILLLLFLFAPAAGMDIPGPWPVTEPTFRSAPYAPADSVQLHRSARDAQARFERIRVQHAPWSFWPSGGPCDEIVGRFCLRFPPPPRGGWDDDPSWRPPPEAREVTVAREDMLRELAVVAAEHPGNAWVVGQRVHYLGEAGRWEEALQVARSCGALRPGWCAGLEGLALHHLGRTPEAETAFDRALEELPEEERNRWLELEWVVEYDGWRELRRANDEERSALEARIWLLSDPLFLLEGNQLRTEHLARRVLSEIHSGARNPHGLSWGRDMEQMLVRYGPEVAYERVRDRSYQPGPIPVVGRFDPFSRRLVPDVEALLAPARAEAGAFSTAERRARSRHSPVEAPTIYGLKPQVARFRRGEDLFVVAAWELPYPLPVGPDSASRRSGAGVVESALFLLPVEGTSREVLRTGSSRVWDREEGEGGIRGVAIVQGEVGEHVLSMEVLDRSGRRAWRHREGMLAEPRHRDLVTLSDLLLLEPDREDGALPAPGSGDPPPEEEGLEAHLSRALPGVDVSAREVEVGWEVYGLSPQVDRLRFRVTVEEEGRGILRRAGEALRLLSPPAPVEIRWEEGRSPPSPAESPADAVLFRRVRLDLSGLEPGSYRLSLSLDLPGRTAVSTSRGLEVSG